QGDFVVEFVVAIEDLDLSAHDAALSVNLFRGEAGAHLNLPAVIGMRTRRDALSADLDGRLRVCPPVADVWRRKHGATCSRGLQEPTSIQGVFANHDFLPTRSRPLPKQSPQRQSAHCYGCV